MQVTKQALKDIQFGVEELAYEVCNEEMLSGQAFYTVLACFCEAKLAELAGELAAWGQSIHFIRGYYVQVPYQLSPNWLICGGISQ